MCNIIFFNKISYLFFKLQVSLIFNYKSNFLSLKDIIFTIIKEQNLNSKKYIFYWYNIIFHVTVQIFHGNN